MLGVALAAAAFVLLRHARSGPTPVVLGSSTKEFAPTALPVAPAPAAAAWPSYGYDLARTHVAPQWFALRPPFRRAWTQAIHDWVEFPPSVAYGLVYIGRLDGVLLAFSASGGRLVWMRRFKPYCTFASPTLAGGVLYETFLPPPCDNGDRSRPGFTVALDARTGRTLWQWTGPASESAPLLRRGVLYEGSWDHHLY